MTSKPQTTKKDVKKKRRLDEIEAPPSGRAVFYGFGVKRTLTAMSSKPWVLGL